MSGWVQLPARVTPGDLQAVQTRLKIDMRAAFRDNGFRYRTTGGRVSVRTDNTDPLVYALPLQRRDGQLRADAAARLTRDTVNGGTDLSVVLDRFDRNHVDLWTGLRLALLAEPDPLRAVRDLAEVRPDCRLYRVGGTATLARRQFVWRVLGHLLDGIPAAAMPLGSARRESMLLTGLLEAIPGAMICAPLTARFQPAAAVLMASNGVEIAMIPNGAGFVRQPHLDAWPVGLGRPTLAGPGGAIYDVGIKTFPEGHLATLLELCVDGGNRLLHRLTDPTNFAGAANEFDWDEQMITWSNVRFGLDALNNAAALWGSTDALWPAFRALGTLQGIWEGRRQGGVPLRELLTPQRLRDYVVPNLQDSTHAAWAAGLINNYERELTRGFPGLTMDRAIRNVDALGRRSYVRARSRQLDNTSRRTAGQT
jgi:hypothetical protein